MRIVHLNTYDVAGGAARSAYRLHTGLRRIHQESLMLVKEKSSTDDTVQAISLLLDEVQRKEVFHFQFVQEHHIGRKRTPVSNTYFSLGYPGWDLSSHPAVQSADIIHLHWLAHYQSPRSLHRLLSLGKPVVWTLHDQRPLTGGCHFSAGCQEFEIKCEQCPQLEKSVWALPEAVLADQRECLSSPNLTIVSPSRWLAQCARQSAVFRGLRVEKIPYSIETEIFRPVPKVEARERLGLNPEGIYFLFGADNGNERRKGFRELLEAFRFCLRTAEFRKAVDEKKVTLVCLGYPSSDLSSLEIPHVALGFQKSEEKLCLAYSAADLFLLPSLEDNLPNTLMEAMSCGTPAVAFNIGGIPDLLVNDFTGKLAVDLRPEKFGKAIMDLFLNSAQRETMGRNCRRIVVDNYALEVQPRRYVQLYEELLNQQKFRETTGLSELPPVGLTTETGSHFAKLKSFLFPADGEFLDWSKEIYASLAEEKKLSRDLLQWAERTEAALAEERMAVKKLRKHWWTRLGRRLKLFETSRNDT